MQDPETYNICSWDIGIKNLAFCILHVHNKEWRIEKWDIVNLVEENNTMCEATVGKTSKMCDKKATLCGKDINKKEHYFCGSHKSKYVPYPDSDKNKWEQEFVKQLSKTNDKTCIKCNKKAHYEILNENYCTVHKNAIIKKITNDTKLVKIKDHGCYESSPQELAENLYKKLDEIIELIHVDHVRIENQPSIVNPIMKTISVLLFSYFVMNKYKSKLKTVKFIAPSSKLKLEENETNELFNRVKTDNQIYALIIKELNKLFNIPESKDQDNKKLINVFYDNCENQDEQLFVIIKLFLWYIINRKSFSLEYAKHKFKIDKDYFMETLSKSKKIYEITKSLSIKYTELLLENDARWLIHFSEYKKKDDISDALLHGIKSIRQLSS